MYFQAKCDFVKRLKIFVINLKKKTYLSCTHLDIFLKLKTLWDIVAVGNKSELILK